MDLLNLSTLNKLNETEQWATVATVATAYSLPSVATTPWCCHPAPQTHPCNSVYVSVFFKGKHRSAELPDFFWGNSLFEEMLDFTSNQEVSCAVRPKEKPVLIACERPPLVTRITGDGMKAGNLVTLSHQWLMQQVCHNDGLRQISETKEEDESQASFQEQGTFLTDGTMACCHTRRISGKSVHV